MKIKLVKRPYDERLEWWAEEFLSTIEGHANTKGHLPKAYIKSAALFWRIQLDCLMATKGKRAKKTK